MKYNWKMSEDSKSILKISPGPLLRWTPSVIRHNPCLVKIMWINCLIFFFWLNSVCSDWYSGCSCRPFILFIYTKYTLWLSSGEFFLLVIFFIERNLHIDFVFRKSVKMWTWERIKNASYLNFWIEFMKIRSD